MPNVYLIRQDHSHLYGTILDTAVVIAESADSARKTLKRLLFKNTDLVWDESFWAITRIGKDAKYPPESYGPVLCKNTRNKDDLPRGNYRAKE